MLEAEGKACWEALCMEELGTFEDRKEASASEEKGSGEPRAQIGYRVQGLLEKTPSRS